MEERKADIAVVGLAVMGQNLILNMNDHGFVVCAYNRTVEKVDEFLANGAKGTKVIGAKSLTDMVLKLKSPRIIMLMIRAGQAVDIFIKNLLEMLANSDVIIDGGNSDYKDTERRFSLCQEKGVHFMGVGVSGGEEGARFGPSIMPGGDKKAWPYLMNIFQSISAKVDGEPCCNWVGSGGAGHYVKMVHNGIEYGDMQLIAEAYHLMKNVLGLTPKEMSKVFADWNKAELDSFLIEITAKILDFEDKNGALVERIRDSAGQKGTGKWTAMSALDIGIPVTLIAESVFARFLSSLKEERVSASKSLRGPKYQFKGDKKKFLDNLRKALYASKIVSYAQGFMLLRNASDQFNWKLRYGNIALMWRGGCIIRSKFLGDIKKAFDKADLKNLLLDNFFREEIDKCQDGWRSTICEGTMAGIPVPALSAALSFYDGYRTANLPANLIQAQRDYFGAHTYELLDSPGQFHHTNWTGAGGKVSSTTYQA